MAHLKTIETFKESLRIPKKSKPTYEENTYMKVYYHDYFKFQSWLKELFDKKHQEIQEKGKDAQYFRMKSSSKSTELFKSKKKKKNDDLFMNPELSLNRNQRIQREKEIIEENIKMVKRIREVKPTLSPKNMFPKKYKAILSKISSKRLSQN